MCFVIFLVMMMSCIPQYIMCIIALYLWYAHYAYMKYRLIYLWLHNNHLYRRRQWKPWKRSERKVCFWSMTRSRHEAENLVVKRNRREMLSAFGKKQMREFVEDWNTANPWTIINLYGRQESKSKRFSGILKVPLKEHLRPRFARVPPSFLMFPRTCCRGAMEDIQYT